MENNKSTSEFEKLVKEATGEIPTVNQEQNDIDEQPKEVQEKDIEIVNEEPRVELPQTKEAKATTIPTNIDTSTSNSQTIGTIKPDKQKSPIAMLILFSALILFIVFMPTAISLFNKYFGTNLNVDSLNNTPKVDVPSTTDNNNQKQEIKMLDLNENTIIQIDKIDISGFKKDYTKGNKLSFYIKNNGTTLYKFAKKLYFDYYDNTNTFVGRSYLENVKEITGGISNSYSIDINNNIYDNATKIELIQRTDDDYPAVSLINNQLTCTNEIENIVYTFDQSSKLLTIKDMFTYMKDDDLMKYNNDLITYKTKVSNLDKLDGVTSVLTENDTGFITTTAIDYNNADYNKLSSNTNYYIKDSYAKTISFEMNAKGYTCR